MCGSVVLVHSKWTQNKKILIQRFYLWSLSENEPCLNAAYSVAMLLVLAARISWGWSFTETSQSVDGGVQKLYGHFMWALYSASTGTPLSLYWCLFFRLWTLFEVWTYLVECRSGCPLRGVLLYAIWAFLWLLIPVDWTVMMCVFCITFNLLWRVFTPWRSNKHEP